VSTGEQVGYLFASLGIPAIGLVLLIVGIVRQSKESKQHYQPGYPPQVGYPHPGQYPAQSGFPASPAIHSPVSTLHSRGSTLHSPGSTSSGLANIRNSQSVARRRRRR